MIAAPVRWPRPSRLDAPLQVASGKTADGLHALGLRTVGELLEHLPTDSREARTVAALQAGEQATVAVQVRVDRERAVRRRGMRPLVEATVLDATGSMRATFFNQPWLVKRYPPGTRLLLHGKADARGLSRLPSRGRRGHARRSRDRCGRPLPGHRGRQLDADPDARAEPAGRARRRPRDAVRGDARGRAAARPGQRARGDALRAQPADSEAGRARLAFEELLLTQLVFLRRRARRRARHGAHALAEEPTLSARWLERGLPFALTGDQRRAIEAIDEDLAQPRAMQRLLMGEVGSGKTVVALYAMLRAVEHGIRPR